VRDGFKDKLELVLPPNLWKDSMAEKQRPTLC
jgi:hypothetical protein